MNPTHTDIGRKRQRDIYVAGAAGQRPAVPVGWAKLEAAAQAAMSIQCGVAEVIGNVLAEFDLTLGLAGCTRVREITRDKIKAG